MRGGLGGIGERTGSGVKIAKTDGHGLPEKDNAVQQKTRPEVDEKGFWAGKTPCWSVRACTPELLLVCPAYLDQSRPCWETEGTLCAKLLEGSTCFVCEVYHRYCPQRR